MHFALFYGKVSITLKPCTCTYFYGAVTIPGLYLHIYINILHIIFAVVLCLFVTHNVTMCMSL